MASLNHLVPSSGRPVRVLIVDDEETLADTLALIVNRTGHHSLAVCTGEAAVNAMQTFHPDVVLSDVMMPGLNGFEPACHLAESFPACKVLLMSGVNSALELAEEHMAKGEGRFINVLTKPVPPRTILNFIANCGPAQVAG